MKLAFITHNYPLDKYERSNAGIFVSDLAENLAGKDCFILVFVLNADVEKKETSFNGRLVVYYLGKGSLKKSLGKAKPYNVLDIIKIFKLFTTGKQSIIAVLKNQKIDFCIAFWAIPSGIVAYQACRELNVPFAIWALGSDIYIYKRYPIIGSLISKAINNSSLLFADGINLSKTVSKISNKMCIFLPSSTNFKVNYRKDILLEKEKINFVFLGRMEKVKGPDILLLSLSKLSRNSNFHAYFLGGGSLLDKLIDMSIKYGLNKKITFLGNINDKKLIYSYLEKSDFLIIPSRSDSIPLVLQEGAKAGIPVIVSNVGDMSDIVKTYKIGYVFQKENIKELALILEKLLKNRKNTKHIFKKNLVVFAKQFDINKISDSLIREIKKFKKK